MARGCLRWVSALPFVLRAAANEKVGCCGEVSRRGLDVLICLDFFVGDGLMCFMSVWEVADGFVRLVWFELR